MLIPSDVESAFRCPISKELMTFPVLFGDGYTYEYKSILTYIKSKLSINSTIRSPITNEVITGPLTLIPNKALRDIMSSFGYTLSDFSREFSDDCSLGSSLVPFQTVYNLFFDPLLTNSQDWTLRIDWAIDVLTNTNLPESTKDLLDVIDRFQYNNFLKLEALLETYITNEILFPKILVIISELPNFPDLPTSLLKHFQMLLFNNTRSYLPTTIVTISKCFLKISNQLLLKHFWWTRSDDTTPLKLLRRIFYPDVVDSSPPLFSELLSVICLLNQRQNLSSHLLLFWQDILSTLLNQNHLSNATVVEKSLSILLDLTVPKSNMYVPLHKVPPSMFRKTIKESLYYLNKAAYGFHAASIWCLIIKNVYRYSIICPTYTISCKDLILQSCNNFSFIEIEDREMLASVLSFVT